MKALMLGAALALAACGSISVDDDGDNGDNGARSDGGGSTADSGTGGGGGGGGGTGPFVAKSGTRIKMKVLTSADGAKSFQGWHDTELDVDCYFSVASDGQMRCLPSGGPGVYVGNFYANDGCSGVPLGYAFNSCATNLSAPYVTRGVNVGDSCTPDSRTTIYDGVTTSYRGPVWLDTGTACDVWSVAGYYFYTLGPVVPPSTFQSGTVAIE